MKKNKFIPPFKDIPSSRQKMSHLSLEERALNFREVELGLSEEQAIAEARRCLSCRKCIGCGLCLAECDKNAIVYDQSEETINIRVDSIILTPGFEDFDANRKKELGYGKYPNVISSTEFERILSENGPFGGIVIRPFDGEIPRRIAFIQCVGAREEAIGANYCSSICCTSAIKEAILAKEKIEGVEIKIFHRDIRPLGRDSEELLLKARDSLGVIFIRAEVIKAEEDPHTGNIKLKYRTPSSSPPYEGGENRGGAHMKGEIVEMEEFDLVVLSVAMAAPREAKDLGRKFGIRLNKYNFCSTNPFAPFNTTKEGIFVAGAFASPEAISHSMVQASSAASKAAIAAQIPNPKSQIPNQPVGLIIGGGICGIAAALDIAEQGFNVHLVEKEKELGGWLSRIHYLSGGEDPQKQLKILLDKVENNDRIQIHRETNIINIQGDTGNFITTISSNGRKESITHGIVIIATGGKVYQPKKYFYGENKNVMLQIELEEKLAKGEFSANTLVMIQCVGSSLIPPNPPLVKGGVRDNEPSTLVSVARVRDRLTDTDTFHGHGTLYCSKICCIEAIKNALKVKAISPNTQVYILHKGIRVYGFDEDYYTDAIDMGIQFIPMEGEPDVQEEIIPPNPPLEKGGRGDLAPLTKGGIGDWGEKGLMVSCIDELRKEKVELRPDILVLSTPILPSDENKKLAKIFGLSLDKWGFFREVEPILRPLETEKEGVFVCGWALYPQLLAECISQASAAAGKACIWWKEKEGKQWLQKS